MCSFSFLQTLKGFQVLHVYDFLNVGFPIFPTYQFEFSLSKSGSIFNSVLFQQKCIISTKCFDSTSSLCCSILLPFISSVIISLSIISLSFQSSFNVSFLQNFSFFLYLSSTSSSSSPFSSSAFLLVSST
jgi:hypothetical protein